jgi:hypothetical protein
MAMEALYRLGYKSSGRQNSQSGNGDWKADMGLMHGKKSSRRDEGLKKWTM